MLCALIISSWARRLALLNSSSRLVTCGNGEGLSVQSVRGWYPISSLNGDSPVVSDVQLLCANSAIGRYSAQLSCRSLTQNRRYCSTHWLDLSDCPSVLGWYAVDMFWSICKILHSSLVNFDANRGSRSLMILVGSPYSLKTFLA